MKGRIRTGGCFLFVVFFVFLGFVGESMSAKPQVDGGYFHTLWVKSDGTLWAWGYNYFGQLGDDTTIDKHSPVQIGSDGDGKTDIAVYRPSNGWWIVMPSSDPSAPYAVAGGILRTFLFLAIMMVTGRRILLCGGPGKGIGILSDLRMGG